MVRTPLPLLRVFTRTLLGNALWFVHKKTALRNLELAFGDRYSHKERFRIGKQSCLMLGEALGEGLCASHRGFAYFEDRIEDAEARAKVAAFERDHDSGWIGLTGHIGNWELLAAWTTIASRSDHNVVVAKRTPNPHINVIIDGIRASLRLETQYQDASPTLAIRALREGRVLGIVPDQDVKTLSGMFVPFFGRPAYTPVGPARIAITAKVPIFVTFMVREGRGFRIQMHDPIYAPKGMSKPDQIAWLTRAWSEKVEAIIREHPEQWPWIHERWKTTPEKLAERGRRALNVGTDRSQVG